MCIIHQNETIQWIEWAQTHQPNGGGVNVFVYIECVSFMLW